MSAPAYIGADSPGQIVKVRLGRFSHYYQDNPVHKAKEGEEPEGAGHQDWDEEAHPCRARVGLHAGPHKNDYYSQPWQGIWLPTTEYVTLPNVLEVKLDKKMEGQVGGIGTASIQIENILYTLQAGGYHLRERGAMSPLRGYHAAASELAPGMPELLDELEKVVESNEWQGVLSYAAQITVWQGFGETKPKTFTGLIEDIDSTSRPDRIVITCRDFGQVFTDTHFIGWGKDPVISTPVVFVDSEMAAQKREVGFNANASSEEGEHTADKVLDFKTTWWQSENHNEGDVTEFVEIGLPEGRYHFATLRAKWAGMECYISLHPAPLAGGKPPTRMIFGELAEDMTTENGLIDKGGWADPTREEGQIVPGTHGGESYMRKVAELAGGDQEAPFEIVAGQPVAYRIGNGSVLRLSFRKLHKLSAEHFAAGVEELHGVREKTEEGAGLAEWVIVEDLADVIRILCQWAGFKEWDIPDTGVRLPQRLTVYQDKSYMDLIKEVTEGIGYMFFMADPSASEDSIGVPVFRKSRVLSPDTEAEKKLREEGKEANGRAALPHRGYDRPGLPNPTITDHSLLTAIDLKQSNEPLSAIIRVWGFSQTQPGDAAAGVASGQFVSYTLRPPWTGTPPTYADSRLGGILKTLVHHDRLFSSQGLCRNAALFIALWQAIESITATIEFPAIPDLDLDDHAQLMDLGTGITTRIAVQSRSSVFTDGEKRKFTMTVTGWLLDSPDVRAMVDIINEVPGHDANGLGGDWADGNPAVGSSGGYE